MNLAEFEFYYKRQMGDLAKALDVTPVYVRAILRGAGKPGKKLCRRIEEISNGHVTAEEARNPPPDKIDLRTPPHRIEICGGC